MKKTLLSISVLFLLVSCSKKVDTPANQTPLSSHVSSQDKKPEVCSFGMTEFNLTKRAPVDIDERRPRGGTTPPPPPPPAGSVIFLDFDGAVLSGTAWNFNPNTNFASANLTATDITEIVNRVTNDYSPFNITITTSESVYNAANAMKRVRVLITESYEWFGSGMGGISYIGAFTWGDNTPSFVFSSLLNYNVKKIAEAASHEAGHSIGLSHQAVYDGGCAMTSEYNFGQGSGENGWAPIMGVGYYQNATLWYNGPNTNGCTSSQDEISIISATVGGLKTDDYSNSTSNAAVLSGTLQGLINSTTDMDFFKITTSSTKTISALPYSVGPNNAGANVNLVLKVYNNSGNLISVIDNTESLGATTTLGAGTYYLSVSTTATQYATQYGMLGKYSIAVN